MKVFYVHHCGISGGASNSLFQLVESFPQETVEIHIVTPDGPVVNLFKNITDNIYIIKKGIPPTIFSAEGIRFIVARSAYAFLNNLQVAKQINKLMKKVQPDIVHLNDNGLIYFAFVAKNLNYKVVMHARTALSKSSKLTNYITNKLIDRYVDYLIPISGSVSRLFPEKIKKKIIYNPYKVNTSIEPSVRSSKEFNCLFLANFLDYKGIRETVEAAKILKGYKHIHFYLAGSNVRSKEFFNSFIGRTLNMLGLYTDFESWIKKEIKEHNLKNVHLLGFVNNIETLFEKGHVMLAPFWLNSPPRNVFEAGVYSIPSILSLQDKVEDVVEDQTNGIIINERSPIDLANAILRLEQDEEFRLMLGENAKSKFRKIHSPSLASNNMLFVYNNLMA